MHHVFFYRKYILLNILVIRFESKIQINTRLEAFRGQTCKRLDPQNKPRDQESNPRVIEEGTLEAAIATQTSDIQNYYERSSLRMETKTMKLRLIRSIREKSPLVDRQSGRATR